MKETKINIREVLLQCYFGWYTNMKLGKSKFYQVRIIFVLKMVTEFVKSLKTKTQKTTDS